MTDPEATLRAVQDAALSRALVSPAAAADHLAFAGALDPARAASPVDGDGTVAALLAATSVGGRSLSGSGSVGPTTANIDGDPPPESRGAALLVERFGVDPDRAASLAARPVEEVRAALAEL